MNAGGVRRFLRGGRLLVFLGIVVVLGLLAARFLAGLYVDVLWFQSVGYLDVFWTRTLWQWGVRLLAGLVTAALVFLNVRIVSSTLGAIQIKRRVGDLEISEKLPRSYVLWGAVGIAVLVGFWFSAAVPPGSGLRSLIFFRAPEWGAVEPIFGHDHSFYVFILPMLRAFLIFGLVLTFLVAGLCAAGYAVTGSLGWSEDGLILGRTARLHLTVLVGTFLGLLALRFWLAQYGLLQDGNSSVQGIFGFADAQARIPGYQALAGLTAACAVAFVWAGFRYRLAVMTSSIAALFIGGIALLQVYPAVVQRFQVEPNELARESPYIEHSLEFTRMGFGLDDLDQRPFDYTRLVESIPRQEAEQQLAGFPVWSDGALLTTFREVEARFRYYQFPEVDFDRYPTPEGPEVVAISARQIDPGGIEDPNWQNLHLRQRYIAGMGAVATAATTLQAESRPRMLLSRIPPEVSQGEDVPPGLQLTRPSIYFGTRPQLYAVLNEGEGVFLGPDGQPGEVGVDFPPGIQLESFLRTIVMAWRFRDANLLFASEISESSRFVFRRQVQERVRQVAPFLTYLESPYPVVHEGRVVWIMEGFTSSRDLPLSSSHDSRTGQAVNYIRNSVKITVDAVTGEMRFYTVIDDEPVLEAYRRAFPDLFRPLAEMPDGLLNHIRYPQSLLEVQGDVLRQYHQETARRFHGQQDVWTRPQELAQGSRSIPYSAQYAHYRLPGEEEPSFLLTTAFVPVGRQNLTGILAARSDPERYGELLLLDVAVDDQVPGPRQVEALVEQDPLISEQFSLWRTGGSQVWTGHLHLIPVAGSLLYMEPVFLAADEDAIPELRRFILSDGRRVIMATSLEEALTILTEGPGAEGPQPMPSVTQPEEGAPAAPPVREWPDEALELLDSAEQSLRQGDWSGFGSNLDRLRSLLQGAETSSPVPEEGGAETVP